MIAVNRRAKLHVNQVWVSYFHRGLYPAGLRIVHWDTLFLSVINSDRLTLSLGKLQVLLGCLGPWKLVCSTVSFDRQALMFVFYPGLSHVSIL